MKPSSGLWRPLRTPIFRHLLIAATVSDVGMFMHSVGVAWFMVSLGASPLYVALTQTASTLPFFVFALPAGTIGDIVDRRRLILYAEAWMLCIAIALAALTLAGAVTPWLLLGLTFALSAGVAIESPAWRAVLPELVGQEDLPAVAALNGIEYNIAQAVGPALAGALVAAAGVGAAFLVHVAAFPGVMMVIGRWDRPMRTRTAPAETLIGATVAALRYVRHAPGIRTVTLRAGAVMFFASAPFSLLPTVVHRISQSALAYGVLLGSFGAGAIAGALLMQPARARWSTEAVVSTTVAIFGAMIVVLSGVHNLPGLVIVMFVSGAPWIILISLSDALAQLLAPDWVRARVLAMFMLVAQGGFAAGSVVWGAVGSYLSVSRALLWAGLGTIATTMLAFVARMPEGAADVRPWSHWRLPDVHNSMPTSEQGPVLVTIQYRVAPQHADAFMDAMGRYERVRRRDGASRWGLYRDLEQVDVYLETFIVTSWAEHLRQHERITLDDGDIERLLAEHTEGERIVRHLIHAEREGGSNRRRRT